MAAEVNLADTARNSPRRRCLSWTEGGQPCRAWAVRGSDPPRCVAHGGATGDAAQTRPDSVMVEDQPGTPAGTGFYSDDPVDVTVNEAIAGLVDKLRRLDRVIDEHESAMLASRQTNGHLVKLFALYAQSSSRLTNMLRARRALSGGAADGIARAIAQALDELSSEWGVEL